MRPYASFFQPFTRPLARQVDQLCCTVDRLCRALREGIVRAVGRAVGDAVREVFHAVLVVPETASDGATDPARLHSHAWWPEEALDRDRWYAGLDEPLTSDDRVERLCHGVEEAEDVAGSGPAVTSRPWYRAWAAGLRVAACSLQCCGFYRIPVAIGAGLLAAFATLADSPVVTASASILGALACLPVFADGTRADADRSPGCVDR
jgi:hypothetical protein